MLDFAKRSLVQLGADSADDFTSLYFHYILKTILGFIILRTFIILIRLLFYRKSKRQIEIFQKHLEIGILTINIVLSIVFYGFIHGMHELNDLPIIIMTWPLLFIICILSIIINVTL